MIREESENELCTGGTGDEGDGKRGEGWGERERGRGRKVKVKVVGSERKKEE